ncbi:hypothetical protein JOQ06_002610, partial [Pogonophryne albipinna]
MDNFFTSIPLAEKLLEKNLTIVGTLRQKKPDIAPVMKLSKLREKHSSESGFIGNMTMEWTQWIRWFPERLVPEFTCKRRTWRRLWHNVLDVATLIAYSIFTAQHPDYMGGVTNVRQRFIKELGKELVMPHTLYEKSAGRIFAFLSRMADIEAKLRVIIADRIEKLVLPSGIPSTLEELQTVVKETFDISDEFSLQYFDSEFEDYFTLHKSDEIKHKGHRHHYPFQSKCHRTMVSHGQNSNPVPQFAFETEMILERATEDFKKNGTLLTNARIQDEFQRITMGGSMGLQLQAIILMAPSNPSIDMSRGLVIRCLMVYLGESTDQLLKEYD